MGQVKDIYVSLNTQDKVLVQIMVQASAANQIDSNRVTIPFPAPGELLFVQVAMPRSRFDSRPDTSSLPQPGTMVRAKLKAGSDWQWTADSPSAFESVRAEEGNIAERADQVPANAATRLGLTLESASTLSGAVVRVKAIEANSPAAAAGIEVGDMLIQANNVALRGDPRAIDDAMQSNDRQVTLFVRDVRTGREVPVDVQLTMVASSSRTEARSLGVSSEVAFYQGGSALKVTAVERNSLAANAGLSPGLLILQVNGQGVEKPEALTSVAPGADGQVTLRVFDPTERSERTIRVGLR
jgi:S1-C subfamily serine protease